MVRLQLIKYEAGMFLPQLSQFHYGSITTFLSLIITFILILSQFHYGSITTSLSKLRDDAWRMSQFHYGSITTTVVSVCLRQGIYWSQFHYGSITTVKRASHKF